MTSRWTLAGLATLLVATGPGSVITRADSGPYTIHDLGMPGVYSVALDLNSDGVAVGFSTPAAGTSTAFRQVAGGGPEPLPDVGGGNTTATGINAAGQIALFGPTAGVFGAFRLGSGAASATNLDPASPLSRTYGIDASGRVVGYSLLDGSLKAVRWNGTATQVIVGSTGTFSAAFGTSDSGEIIVGSSGMEAFAWTTGGGYAALPLPAGGSMASALSANNAGDVVGYSVAASFAGTLWPANSAPVVLDGFEQASDVNAHRQVVGFGRTVAGDERALLWQDGVTIDLNSVLEPGSGWVLTRANAINDAGQIVGEGEFGGLHRGFLLTPPALSDITPPVISSVSTTPDAIWPPSHQMVAVSVRVSATDDSGETPVCAVTHVTSSEPDNNSGDGNTHGDTAILGPLAVTVRAERSGPVGARLYAVNVECRDGSGNAATSAGAVRVGELSTTQKVAVKNAKGGKNK